MNSISRRSLLRAGGASGAALMAAGYPLTPASAAWDPVQAWLDRSVVAAGERLVLNVHESLRLDCRIAVHDATGLAWKPTSIGTRSQVWVSGAAQAGQGSVTVVTTRDDGKVLREVVPYRVTSTTAGGAATGALIGMSAPASVWDRKVDQVGPGLGARRIFADLGDGADSQLKLVEEAHNAGLLPVISYKVGGDISGAINGRFNAAAEKAAAELASYRLPTAVAVWHEPYGDLNGAQYAALSKELLPIFKRGEVRVGPILNGWLLDNKRAEFESFCPKALFDMWQYVAIDTYESGSMGDPGPVKPAPRIPALSAYVKSRGYDLPLGVGEYNGYTADAIADVGDALLSTPNVWFGCVWNVTGGIGVELSGDRLAAFRGTLADPRAGSPRAT